MAVHTSLLDFHVDPAIISSAGNEGGEDENFVVVFLV